MEKSRNQLGPIAERKSVLAHIIIRVFASRPTTKTAAAFLLKCGKEV